MNDLVDVVASRLALPAAEARPLVTTVLMALRERLPASVASQLDLVLRDELHADGTAQRVGRELERLFG